MVCLDFLGQCDVLVLNNLSQSSGLQPCLCFACHGALRNRDERRNHEARDRRRASSRPSSVAPSVVSFSSRGAAPDPAPPAATSSYTLTPTVTFASQPRSKRMRTWEPPIQEENPVPELELPNESVMGDEPAQGMFSSDQQQAVSAAEASGLVHVEQVLWSGEIFDEIAADDWEDEVDEEPPLSSDEELPEAPSLGVHATATSSRGTPVRPEPTTDENNPDPFYYPPETPRAPPTPTDVHPNRVVYIIYLLVLWLHSQCHLPFRACNAVLVVFSIVLRAVESPIEPPMYTTLPSVITSLGADPTFKICPVCPGCLEVYPSTTPADATCTKCSSSLFVNTPTPAEQRRGRTTRENPKPHIQFPTKSLEEQLATLLSVPGIEDILETYTTKINNTVPGKYTNIFDGKICQELPGPNSSRFFHPTEEELAAGELRIGVSLGVDWSVLLIVSSVHV